MLRIGITLVALTLASACDAGTSPAPVVPAPSESASTVPTPAIDLSTDRPVQALCPSGNGGSATVDVPRAITRTEAGAYPQSALEAAREFRASPRLDRSFEDGRLIAVAPEPREVLYLVVDDGTQVARVTVSQIGYGAWAVTSFENCQA